jgi:hypothetical protein
MEWKGIADPAIARLVASGVSDPRSGRSVEDILNLPEARSTESWICWVFYCISTEEYF